MKKTLLFLTGIVLTFSNNVFSQENTENKTRLQLKHSIGIGAGFTTGYGMSYRFMINKFGIQTTTAPYKDKNKTEFNIGATLLFKLVDEQNVNLFIYQGNQYNYKKQKYSRYYYYDYFYYPEPIEENSIPTKTEYFNHSIGIGLEFIILKHVSFNMMGGYAGYKNFEKISWTGETGIYYVF